MPIMFPSLSLNHAARVGPVVAMPLWVLRLGKSYSSNTTARSQMEDFRVAKALDYVDFSPIAGPSGYRTMTAERPPLPRRSLRATRSQHKERLRPDLKYPLDFRLQPRQRFRRNAGAPGRN